MFNPFNSLLVLCMTIHGGLGQRPQYLSFMEIVIQFSFWGLFYVGLKSGTTYNLLTLTCTNLYILYSVAPQDNKTIYLPAHRCSYHIISELRKSICPLFLV